MQTQLVALVILASLSQVKKDGRPIPPPPRRIGVIQIGVRDAGRGEMRTISLSMPAPPAQADEADEGDEQPPAPPIMHFNLNTAVVDARELRPLAVRRRTIRERAPEASG